MSKALESRHLLPAAGRIEGLAKSTKLEGETWLASPPFKPKANSCTSTVDLSNKELRKKNICLQTLEVGANDRSAQEFQNSLKNEVHTKFLTELLVWSF